MKGPAFAAAVFLCLLATCVRAQTTSPKTDYTEKEYSAMLYCVGLTDTAWTNAEQKLQGVSLEDAKKRYEGKLDGNQKTLVLRIVDRVYGDSFKSSWDYAVSFFSECGQNLANVPPDRTGLAGYCMQNSMIAMTAQGYKDAGLPAEKVYGHFAKLDNGPGSTPRPVIDWVYANSYTRANAGVEEWKACMAPLRAKEPSPSK